MSSEENDIIMRPLHVDCTVFDLVFTKSSRPDRIQLITGNVDGTLRLYTAKGETQFQEELSEYRKDKGESQIVAKDIEKELERAGAEDLEVDGQVELDELSDTDLYGEEGFKEEEDSADEDEIDPYELDWALQQTKKGSVRGIAKVPNSNALLSVSSVGTFAMSDIEAGKFIFDRVQKIPTAFEKIEVISENQVAAGDDDGHVFMWDIRDPRRTFVQDVKKGTTTSSSSKSTKEAKDMWIVPSWEHQDHADYISGLKYGEGRRELVSSSGDGHVCIYDVRTGKFTHGSERLRGEILSLELAMDNELILYGFNHGVVTGSWRSKFEFYNNFKVRRGSIDLLVRDPKNPDHVYAACENGSIAVLDVESAMVTGVLGAHRSPISAMAADSSSVVVGCASKDDVVRFWDSSKIQRMKRKFKAKSNNNAVSIVDSDDDSDDFDEDEDEDSLSFSDDDDDDDDSDDSDEEIEKKTNNMSFSDDEDIDDTKFSERKHKNVVEKEKKKVKVDNQNQNQNDKNKKENTVKTRGGFFGGL